MRRVFALWLIAGAAGVARGQPAEVSSRHVRIAQEHYAAARYDEALGELQAAYQADPQPELLFAIAQVYKAKQDCAKAIKAYGEYLRTGPRPAATRMTQLAIDECVAMLPPAPGPAQPVPEPAVQVAPPAPPPPSEPMIIREVQRVVTKDVTLPWYRDNWGNALVATGLGSALAGTVAFALASSYDTEATTSTRYDDFDNNLRARDRSRVVGTASLAVAGGLVIGGLLHYALRPKRVKTEVLVDPATRSGGVGVSWVLP